MPEFILSALVVAAAVWVLLVFNRLVRQRNRLREAWSGIDVQLKRRHDLIPNLVELVKQYRDYEREVLEHVTAARTARGVEDTGAAENNVSRDLRQLFAVAEAYPDLKADANFRQLGSSLVEIEEHLQYARRYYNGSARDMNIMVQTFPNLLVARLFGFQEAAFFEIELATGRDAPEVKL